MSDPDKMVEFAAITRSIKYDTASSAVAQITPWDGTNTRTVKIGYGDAWNDNVSRTPYGYPTTVTDVTGNRSSSMFDARQFWRSIFLESSWSADLWASLIFAIPFSAMSEVLADSGEWRGGRMITSTAVAAGAYLASYFMFRARTPSKLRMPSWIYVGGVGSLFYAFIWRLIYRPVVGWSETRIDSLEEYLQGMVHDVRAFFILVVLVPPLCMSVLLAIRLVKALMLAYTSDGQERVNLP